MNDLSLIKSVSWEEVFQTWKSQEGTVESWQKLAIEKGWPDWEAWRKNCANIIGAPDLVWNLYQVENYNELMPSMVVGPYKSWQKQLDGEKKFGRRTFQELVESKKEWCLANSGILRMMDNFPEDALLIGIFFKDEDLLVCFEGHHRCAAVALAKSLGEPLRLSQLPKMAVAEMSSAQVKNLELLLDKGTENPN